MIRPRFAPAPLRRMHHAGRPPRVREGGAIIVLVAVTLILMIGFVGLAIDLGQMYNRKAEMHGVAQAVALAAAGQLNGTSAGIDAALVKASEVAILYRYRYNKLKFGGSDTALTFSSSPSATGSWLPAGSAKVSPANVYYAKVDASLLTPGSDVIRTLFIHTLPSHTASVSVNHVAIAGRTSINMTPLGVCALSSTPAAARVNTNTPVLTELVEFGFRRGVTYDLMQLNPNGTTPENFLIDPIAAPGSTSSPAHMTDVVAAPFVCSGAMWMPRVSGGAIGLQRPFPLATMAAYLNTRFNIYAGTNCQPSGAAPDANVKPFMPNTASTNWMVSAPAGQSATSIILNGKLLTAADRPDTAGNTPGGVPRKSGGPVYAPTIVILGGCSETVRDRR